MAEIILPPEENEETPQEPDLNIDKPTENSKVISIEFEAKKTNKVSTKDTKQQLYTTDTDAWFEFKETSLEGANGTYSVVFRNRHDGSIFQRTGDVANGVAYYKIPHQEIRHAGAWRGQVVYTLSNGDTTAREFDYDVKGHILDGKDVREIVVEDFETLMSQLRSMKDNAEVELANLTQELRNTTNTAEQNETDRQIFFDDLFEDIDELQANYQELLDTGVLQTNINTKLEALEEEYAPRLTEVTTQLGQTTDETTFNVKGYGAIGDGVTDDTQAIQNVFNNVKVGDTVLIPNGTFLTKDTITVTKPVRVIMNGYILADHEKAGLIFKDNSSYGSFHPNYHNGEKIEATIRVKRVKNKDYELNSTAVGLEIWNVFSGVIHLEDLEGHHIGVHFRAEEYGTGYAGTSYCMFTIGVLNNYKDNMLFTTGYRGWITQNQFYSGSVTGTLTEGLETIHVNIDGTERGGSGYISANTFYSMSFEGGKRKAVKARYSVSNRFIDCRYEMPNMTHVFDLEESHSYLFDKGTLLSNHMMNGLYNDNEETKESYWKNTHVNFTDYRLGSVEYIDGIFYIKPKKSHTGRSELAVNSILPSNIPEKWDNIRFSTGGKQTFRSNSSQSNMVGDTHILSIKHGTELMVQHNSQYPYDNVELTEPPNFSTEIMLHVSYNVKDVNLKIDDTISNFYDRTGAGLSVPNGHQWARLYYNYTTNSLYLLETF